MKQTPGGNSGKSPSTFDSPDKATGKKKKKSLGIMLHAEGNK